MGARVPTLGAENLLPMLQEGSRVQKPARMETTEQRACPSAGRQCLPPRPGKEIPSEPDLSISGRLLQASKPTKRVHFLFFASL